jgi:low temperature requirement protein LtrA
VTGLAISGRARRASTGDEQRATFLELFLDLVFVFAVTQVSHVLLEDLSLAGAAKMLFLLLVVWWAWIYTAWMTNWFDPDEIAVRLVLLTGMLASLLMAIAIPDAFGDRALLFAVGYVGLQFVRNTFIVLATDASEPLHRPFQRLWAWNAWVGVVWVVGALLPEESRVVVWIAALALDYAGPLAGYWTPGLGRTPITDWELEHGHFGERFQLFIIIALGETIVLTGATASDLELTLPRGLAIVTAFLATAALWWLYFDVVARRSLEDFAAADDRKGLLGRDAYTYLHIPIVAGIIVNAVGDELVIARPTERLAANELAVLAAGPILYLLGHVAFRLRMTGTVGTKRLIATVLIAASAVAGAALPALAVGVTILAILVLLAAWEWLDRPGQRRLASVDVV